VEWSLPEWTTEAMRNKHKKEEICNSLVWWGRIIGQSTDNHSQAELGLIIRSTTQKKMPRIAKQIFANTDKK
jgi:hypothetical protein